MKKIILIASFLSILLISCKKDYLDRKPISDLTIENAIYDDVSAEKAVKGAYGCLRQQKIYGRDYVYIAEASSDDMTYNEIPSTSVPFDRLQTTSITPQYSSMWLGCYDGLQRCNFVLTSIANASNISADKKKIYAAECHFLRAYYYWLLVTVFGEVPIYTQVPKNFEEIYVKQSPINDVYDLIERDLAIASSDLPESWSGSQYEGKGRATRYSAIAMLGKVYLYQQKWQQARDEFAKVIAKADGNTIGLQPKDKFSNNFNEKTENGLESIFEIQNYSAAASEGAGIYFSDGGVSGANNFRSVIMGVKDLSGTVNFGEIVATRNLFNEFEPNDPRLRATLWVQNCDRDTTVRNNTYCICEDKFFIGKFFTPFDKGVFFKRFEVQNRLGELFWVRKGLPGANQTGLASDDGTNIPVIRYADVLLMYAEAAAESGDLNEAIAKLNMVRDRAGLAPFPYTTTYGGHQFKDFKPRTGAVLTWLRTPGLNVNYSANLEDFRKALVHERRVELAAEYHRYQDLVRWSKIPNHPGSAFTVFESKKNDPIERTAPEDHITFTERDKLFPKPLVEIDKSRGTLTQNPGY